MTLSVAAFAHLASSASRERVGFESTQVIESGGLRIEARIRRRGARSIQVEYKTYQSPWAELQEALSGQVELVGEELCGLTLDCEGQNTWVVDPSTNTAILKEGSHLFEPIPGLATLGELSFLDSLTQDFLLRDLGEETIDDRVVRRIGLKPKQTYRSQLLSAVVFPIRKATIAFDTETYFPVSISFVPSSESPAASIIGPNATIRVSYKDVQMLETDSTPPSFAPPADAKRFEEKAISADELAKQLPFPVSSELLSKYGFDPEDAIALLSRDAEQNRTFATVQYASNGSSEETSSQEEASSERKTSSQEEASSERETSSHEEALTPRLTITFGDYVSKNMARRRTTFSESGKPASEPSLPIKLLDRRELWEQRFPGIDTRYAPVDAFFEKDGVFWFLSGTGMDLDSMEALAKDLLESEPKPVLETEPESELETE